jgi:hypothetical protein
MMMNSVAVTASGRIPLGFLFIRGTDADANNLPDFAGCILVACSSHRFIR